MRAWFRSRSSRFLAWRFELTVPPKPHLRKGAKKPDVHQRKGCLCAEMGAKEVGISNSWVSPLSDARGLREVSAGDGDGISYQRSDGRFVCGWSSLSHGTAEIHGTAKIGSG